MPNETADVAEGFTELPGGVVRKLRVNRRFIGWGSEKGANKPWILAEDGQEKAYADVRFLGTVTPKCGEGEDPNGCGMEGRAWLETDGPLLVK